MSFCLNFICWVCLLLKASGIFDNSWKHVKPSPFSAISFCAVRFLSTSFTSQIATPVQGKGKGKGKGSPKGYTVSKVGFKINTNILHHFLNKLSIIDWIHMTWNSIFNHRECYYFIIIVVIDSTHNLDQSFSNKNNIKNK